MSRRKVKKSLVSKKKTTKTRDEYISMLSSEHFILLPLSKRYTSKLLYHAFELTVKSTNAHHIIVSQVLFCNSAHHLLLSQLLSSLHYLSLPAVYVRLCYVLVFCTHLHRTRCNSTDTSTFPTSASLRRIFLYDIENHLIVYKATLRFTRSPARTSTGLLGFHCINNGQIYTRSLHSNTVESTLLFTLERLRENTTFSDPLTIYM